MQQEQPMSLLKRLQRASRKIIKLMVKWRIKNSNIVLRVLARRTIKEFL